MRDKIFPAVYKPAPVRNNTEEMFHKLVPSPARSDIVKNDNCFQFLNWEHCFDQEINWSFSQYGKLWTYNLNYFEFINQLELSAEKSRVLIKSFVESLQPGHTGLEPYPLSLRGINLIKYLIANNLYESTILESLYGQYKLLLKNIEYHLLGNHILENGLSLLAGGVFFNDRILINKGKKILEDELEEQIMKDGAHFEKSLMYQQILVERILDVINILNSRNSTTGLDYIYATLCSRAGLMLGWLENMTFADGSVPHFNDSTYGISFDTSTLRTYASDLNISAFNANLDESGFRRYKMNNYDIIVDVGDIGPDYQPGHAHSDTFSFILHINNTPVIVDTGVSTYENNSQRLSERRTSAHNTFQLKGVEQTDVWSSFRVGRRAYCTILEETSEKLHASHDGYKSRRLMAERYFEFFSDEIIINDKLPDAPAIGYLHFHPDISFNLKENRAEFLHFDILFENHDNIEAGVYEFAEGFNKTRSASMLTISFRSFMTSRIIMK